MRAAVLCPGPSLGRWPDDSWCSYDVTVAVNRAALRAPCTDWVFADLAPFTDARPGLLKLPRLWTASIVATYMPAEAPNCYDVLEGRFPFQVNTYKPQGVVDWRSYSATAALIVAASYGAETIDVYGADWAAHAPDWDGKMINEAPEIERGPDRWQNEALIWNAVVYDLSLKGITVTRCQVSTPC